jgi:glycosyltransferase involved in cell wall biosynthesis
MFPGWVESVFLLLYLGLGPLIWITYGILLSAGRRRMLLMKRSPEPLIGPLPSVTILIPAKDEGERIRACIASALGQDYPNFDVITIDDRSTDRTGAVMDEMAAADPRMKVLHITEPPGFGWTGKNSALHHGTKLAGGEWLLFVDSDVILKPDVLDIAMGVVRRKQFDLLSLLPRLESHSFWEALLVPLAAGAAAGLYLISLTNTQNTRTAFANGQFMLMRRTAYDAMGGHEAVKDRLCEDMEFARQFKQRGLRPRVSWGDEYATVRMYSSLSAIFRGWSRIYYAAYVGRPWRILIGISFVMACCMSAWAALGWGIYRCVAPGLLLHGDSGAAWLAVAGAHVVLMTYFLGVMYRWSGNSPGNALFFLPLSGPMLLTMFVRGLIMCVTKKVEWRGTAYSHTMAADLANPAPTTRG